MWFVVTTVWGISLTFPFNGALGGNDVRESIFKANDTIAYLAVTDLNQQRVVSTLECDVKCSQYPDCIVMVHNRSTSSCAMFRLFDSTQDKTPHILHGNFDVTHFMVNDNTPIQPSCPYQPLPLKNANVSNGNQLVGNVRTYTCLHGYRDISTNKTSANTTCLGNLTWTHAALQCSGRDIVKSDLHSTHSCQNKPPPMDNARVRGNDLAVGSVWQYSCHNGYMDSETDIAYTKCLENLTWSHAGLQCIGPWLLKITSAKCSKMKLKKTELEKVFANKTLIFLVQTRYNAYVHFREIKTNKICFGCGKNTYLGIGGCQSKPEKEILSWEEFRPFWIRFHEDRVAVGKGLTVGEGQAMSCRVSKIRLNYLKLSTCAKDKGIWRFLEHGV